jgi:epoxyqueuosine reductase
MIKAAVEKIFNKHGFTAYFAEFCEVSIEPKANEKGYKTVFLTYVPYAYTPSAEQNICRYAALEDYHVYLPKKLNGIKKDLEETFRGSIFDIYTDNSPIDEKKAAEISGLGIRGRNSLIISKEHGSFILLGEIITDLDIPCESRAPEYCENCGRCEKACPSGALKDGRINRERCVSALTQKKGVLTPEEEDLIIKNGLIWGCDRCQEVCPYNAKASSSDYADNSVKLTRITPEDIDGLTDRQFREKYAGRAFTWRGLAPIKRNIKLIERKGEKQ